MFEISFFCDYLDQNLVNQCFNFECNFRFEFWNTNFDKYNNMCHLQNSLQSYIYPKYRNLR